MCEAWPGPRCSPEMKTRLATRSRKKEEAFKKYGENSFEYLKASAFLEAAQKDYDSTPKGIEELEILVQANPSNEEYISRLVAAKNTRKAQTNAVTEIKNGRQDLITSIHHKVQSFYSKEEMLSIIESSREDQEGLLRKYPNKSLNPITDKEYQAYCDSLEATLKTYYSGRGQEIPEDMIEVVNKLRELPVPDRLNFTAYKNIVRNIETSRQQLDNELVKIAAIQNVSPRIAASFYDGYRNQYNMIFANLPESEKPDPPEKWVRGEMPYSGYAQDFNSKFAPHDPASMYAVYRLRTDAEAIPDHYKQNRSVASIDLETAGPHGGVGFSPENGRIIEVGIINYTRNGKELSRYSQLVRPEEEFLQKHGTGSEDVHQISVTDLNGQPSWEQVSPKILSILDAKTLLAQNAKFEKSWLAHHSDENFIKNIPVIDTLDLGRKCLDLPNYRLETLCGEVGVPYTEGHRALHDAEVAARVFFGIRKTIKKIWRSKAARKNAPAIDSLLPSRWG